MMIDTRAGGFSPKSISSGMCCSNEPDRVSSISEGNFALAVSDTCCSDGG